ncbi:ornithine decarboxylase-like [Ochlerotatus camptorhynchus]|uniref:ornithine decarboxylase-like n=1 Tax=Ochlerotatus camptorhynchus TaxID=644619 RepID=UPI0031E116C3
MCYLKEGRRDFTLLKSDSTIQEILDEILKSPAREDPFHVLDLDDVVQKHHNWLELLPRVKPFYAVKCNDDPFILETLACLGTGFDCASKAEIRKILEMGVEPERIIYAHPVKSKESLQFAQEKRVTKMTFDSELELEKIANYYPGAELVLRFRHDSAKVLISLGKKFGCDAHVDGLELIRKAKDLNLNVIGVSFHVGCGSKDADCYYDAIKSAKSLFEFASSVGYRFSLIDIGGGFPGDTDKSIDGYTEVINRALDEFFPGLNGVEVIAEPGRYYAGSAVRLFTTIHGKKFVKNSDAESQVMYYINDGVFGTLFDWVSLRAVHDLARVIPTITKAKLGKPLLRTTIWGPTCDSTDIVCEDVDFPEHDIGEYMLFENIGAYGITFATSFNGFPSPTIRVYVKEKTWTGLSDLKLMSGLDKTIDILRSRFQ